MKTTTLLVSIALAVLSGCAQQIPTYRVNHKFVQSPPTYAPKKVLIMPVDVTIKEVTAGGVAEEVPEWSKQGAANVHTALNDYFRSAKKKEVQLIEMPKLVDKDRETLLQHLALYRRVAGAVTSQTYGMQPWLHKIQKFDYTLGDGLKSIGARTGADSAIVVFGEDEVSTTGRKIAAVFMDNVSLGHSFLAAAFVNFNSGDIIWFNYAYQYKNTDLRKPGDAAYIVERLFEEYPGVDRYQQLKLVQ